MLKFNNSTFEIILSYANIYIFIIPHSIFHKFFSIYGKIKVDFDEGSGHMSKAYFIEGIPGSGKTTYAKRLYDHFKAKGESVELYNEGDLHPIDLAWCSIIKTDTFNKLTEKHSVYRDQILSHSKFIEDIVITAYTKVEVDDKDVSFFDDFSHYEIYRTKDFSHFRDTHLTLWETFNQTHKKDTTYIFECIYLQNHINELKLKFSLSETDMIDYFQDLMDKLSKFETTILYIKPLNIKATFDKVIEERKSNNKNYKDWIDQVIEYLEGTKLGKKLGYVGYDGALKYFIDRQKLECDLLRNLTTKKVIFEQKEDYDIVFNMIINYLE